MRRLAVLFALAALTACDADAHEKHHTRVPTPPPYYPPTPTPIAQPTPLSTGTNTAEFYVRNGQEIWMHTAGTGVAKRLVKLDRHEGLGELHVSPDKHWLWVTVTYPYD